MTITSNKSELKEAHIGCPCGKSSDAYSTYEDGHGYCFSCSKYFSSEGTKEITAVDTENAEYRFHPHRGISEKTFEFYNVYTEFVNCEPTKVGFIYPNNAIKFRSYTKKEFFSEGPMSEAGCFGTDKFDPGSKETLVITEGEYDALAVYEATRGRVAAISVRSASSAKRDCTRDYEYINSFSRIVLAFDSDEAGHNAARSVSGLFDYNKVYHSRHSKHKDANAYLEAGEVEDFVASLDAARRYAPDNIISTYAEFEQSLAKRKEAILATYPFTTLTSRLYGLLAGSVTVFKGLEGIGKTEIFRAIQYHVLSTTDHNIGILHFEEDNGDTIKALAGYTLRTPTTVPDSTVSDKDVIRAIRKLTNNDESRIHIHASWDVEDENAILDNIRYLVSAAGCRIIFLDHISWLATGQDDDDERKKLDRISQKLKLLAKELQCAILVISHVNDNGQTRGSRNITKNANNVVHMSRDTTSNDETLRNTIYLTVEKARLGGNTGPAGELIFDRDTFTLREKDKIDAIKVPRIT